MSSGPGLEVAVLGGMIPKSQNSNIKKNSKNQTPDLAWRLLLSEVCFLLEHLEGGFLQLEVSLVLMIRYIMIQLEDFTEKSQKFTVLRLF